jgi:hypothetical protein
MLPSFKEGNQKRGDEGAGRCDRKEVGMEQRKRRLQVDLDELCYALDDSSYEHDYYLDLETGELLLLSDYMDTEETDELGE